MRLLAFALLCSCATVETERVVESTRGAERCSGELVAAVFPGDWPDVVLEIVEQRSCETPIQDKVEVARELHVSKWVGYGIGAALGLGAGIAADVLLVNATSSGSSFNRGDGYLLLPIAGAAAGALLVDNMHLERQTQPLPQEVRYVTSFTHRDIEHHAAKGLLSHGTTPLGVVKNGRTALPLELAMSVYGRPLKLDGYPVDWSVRSAAWVPGKLPACVRAAAFDEAVSYANAPASDLSRAENDAEACAKDGWPFATRMLAKLQHTCSGRFGKSCWDAR